MRRQFRRPGPWGLRLLPPLGRRILGMKRFSLGGMSRDDRIGNVCQSASAS